MISHEKLKADALRRRCNAEELSFKTTDDLEPLEEIIGQPRAVDAVRFGIEVDQQGYNIFALGPPGVGKLSLVRQFLRKRASEQPAPPDFCYVNNFEQPHKPRALELPTGRGRKLQADMESLVDDAQATLGSAFESDSYQNRRQKLQEQVAEQHKSSMEEVQEAAKQRGLAVMQSPQGLAIAPLGEDGKPMSTEEVQQLPDDKREELQEKAEELQRKMQEVFQEAPRVQRQMRQKLKELNRDVAEKALAPLIDELKQDYQDVEKVEEYLDAVKEDMVEHADEILKSFQASQGQQDEEQKGPHLQVRPPLPSSLRDSPLLRRYRVNALVTRDNGDGAPLVYEDHPNYPNLIGRVDHMVQMGTLVADFNLIKPGALHRANGGYLILDAHKLLMQPPLWEALKRALRAEEIRIESLTEAVGLMRTVSLEPEPIPLRVKVVVMGRPVLYQLLRALDEDFAELFKVPADFGMDIDWDADDQQLYARLVATLVRKESLKPFDRDAVARVIEQSGRMAGDTKKLSVHMRTVVDLLHEADHWARQDGGESVSADDVEKAIEKQIYRSNRLAERIREEIGRGTILIDTDGQSVGQINGLAVMQFGDYRFGRPSRITARVRMGSGKVVDIEREVELGGPVHSKGVLILAGFLSGRYARDLPLSLSASLVFEQSYGGIGGDSASLAELLALLSSIADVPLHQSVAVTGSVNQQGRVQAIGAVNEKIEGFFDVCRAGDLTGRQGVIIPAANAQHLMLRQDIIDAVDEGTFHIHSVETVDDAIELMTDLSAGQRDPEGRFPDDSLNGKVAASLEAFAERRKKFGVVKSDSDSSSS